MPIKMIQDTPEQRVYMNVTANQCPGCPENLATRLVMHIVFDHLREENPIIFGQGCGIGRDFLQRSGLGTHDSGIAGMLTAMKVRNIDRPIVVIDGDGQIDLGLEDMATSFQQGYKYLHVVCDNQAHAASGSHATGSTAPMARTSVRPSGKLRHPKHFALMLMFSGAEYVATASTSHPQDLERKIKAACDRLPAFHSDPDSLQPLLGLRRQQGDRSFPAGGGERYLAPVRVEGRRVSEAEHHAQVHCP